MNSSLPSNWTATEPARVFIVDDHPSVRLGFKALIDTEPGLKVCGETDGSDTLKTVRTCQPDVIILDLKLGDDQSGMDLIRGLRAEGVEVPILVISSWDERLYAKRVLKAGANGYIMKNEANSLVIEGLKRVLNGNVYLTPAMTQFHVDHIGQESPIESLEKLTDRELQILELMGNGKNTQAISDNLNISSKTVDAHRANIKVKLGIDDLHELIRFAVQLVDSGDLSKLPKLQQQD